MKIEIPVPCSSINEVNNKLALLMKVLISRIITFILVLVVLGVSLWGL
jgi:hypothetical protein